MRPPIDDTAARSRWLLLLYGLLGLAFGAAVLLWPENTVIALVMAFGALAVVDGVYALLRRQRDQADPACLWCIDRRARRRSPRDCAKGRFARFGAGPGFRPDVALPDCRLNS